MGPDDFSDFGYGSGASTNSGKSWPSQDLWPQFKTGLERRRTSSSFLDLVMNQCTLEDAMQEFRMNGSDSPYNPDEERWNVHQAVPSDPLVGMGPCSQYLRQKSWPQPERSPAVQLPKTSEWKLNAEEFRPAHTRVPVPEASPQNNQVNQDVISQEQLQLLLSLPNHVLHSLLRELEEQGFERRSKKRQNEPLQQECRFCKNNGEREAYYRSHALKRGGRVSCPVLRAFTCRRCGATGDSAHTAKYCPLATNEERKKSTAMMRSVRQASGRRRACASSELVQFGAASRAVLDDNRAFASFLDAPLDERWAALEQKLML